MARQDGVPSEVQARGIRKGGIPAKDLIRVPGGQKARICMAIYGLGVVAWRQEL